MAVSHVVFIIGTVNVVGSGLASTGHGIGAFTETIAPLIKSSGVALQELQPADDSLESVFAYLVDR